MPRSSRESFCSVFFHNMVQGINKEYIFEKDVEKRKYIKLLNEVNLENGKLISYTIMDNHAHILLYANDIHSMSKFMKMVNENFATYYNFINQRVGVVFRNRFKTQEILSKEHLYKCIKYIYNNPVKANIVKDIDEYPYSNYKQFIERRLLDEIFEDSLSEKKGKSISSYVCNVDSEYRKNQEVLEKFSEKEYFIDTKEDISYYAKDLLEVYLKDKKLDNKESLKKFLKEVRGEINITYSALSEILGIPKTTIWELMKQEGSKHDNKIE